ncbi:hypothetical protein [Lacimicrobium alkaliphilum]|uniref:Uncharacterized protein n=1 Tax=Lacimicrobium alkaliphilum TaxID=1526571 RepID=A0A0U2QQN4_9ALTE|nr:hypothetical protein [Lacimicrobium alkaliphilum]ALT00108.1 hypothetical protein AT746_18760 [Lacimicrobium alkaliphilum]
MIRLSKRGWNNVLIFATLLLILVFHQSGEFFNQAPAPSQSQSLLPEDVPVMKIDFGTHRLERIGQGWRIRPGLELNESELGLLVDNWQQIVVTPFSGGKLQNTAVVVIWLAGQSEGVVFQLTQQGDDLLLQHQSRLYRAENRQINEFIPQEIL